MTMISKSDNNASNALSKSQKKRLKRSSTKAKKEAEKPLLSLADLENSLNPQDKVRASLVKLGFHIDEIDQALEEMWNSQLLYDDVDSVYNYLQLKTAAGKDLRSSNQPSSDDNFESPSESPVEQMEMTNPEPIDLTFDQGNQIIDALVSPTDSESKSLSMGERQQIGANRIDVSMANFDSVEPESQPDTLASKLEIVANYENLSDAITALSEWMSKAATVPEIQKFCSSSSSAAFSTVTRRCILETSGGANGLLIDLFTSLLRALGVPIASAIGAAKSLLLLIQKVQSSSSSLVLIDTIVSKIPGELTALISNALNSISSDNVETEKNIMRLEEDINELMTLKYSLPDVGGVRELMWKRDRNKTAASKFFTIFQLSNKSLIRSHTKVSKPNHTFHVEEKNYLISFLGEKLDEVKNARQKFDDLHRQFSESNATVTSTKSALLSDLNTYRVQQKMIGDRIKELEHELQKLSNDSALICDKIRQTEANLSLIENSLSDEARKMKHDMDKLAHLVQIEGEASDIVHCLRNFDAALEKVAADSAASKTVSFDDSSLEDNLHKVNKRFGMYLVWMKNYFEAESDMVAFLIKRSRDLEEALPELEKQLEECTMLGMKTNVTEMSKELKETSRKISDDKAVIVALQQEAGQMKNEFLEQLEDFFVHYKKVNTEASVLSLYSSLISQIRVSISMIGLHVDERFNVACDAFVSNGNSHASEMADIAKKLASEKNGTSHNVVEPTVLQTVVSNKSMQEGSFSEVKPSFVPIAPKLAVAPSIKMGWAAVAAAKKQPTLSLVDIQEEQKQNS